MKIIIVGCGKIGRAILKTLVGEGYDIIAVDNNEVVINEVTNVYDVMSVCGNGAVYDTLNEAGADSADLFIAVTASDELNMLACYLAQKMGAKNTIARIRNPEYNDEKIAFLRESLKLSLSLNPEQLAAQEIYNLLKLPTAIKVESFSRRNLVMIEMYIAEDSDLDGVKISKLKSKINASFLIAAVQRDGETRVPGGNFELKSGDKIALVGSHNEIQKFLKEIDELRRSAKNIMIIGGGRLAYYVAKSLEGTSTSVKIIEKDFERAEVLSSVLADAVIINGNGAEQEVMLEEDIVSMDSFVTLTGMDEENILLSMFAKTKEIPKIITKVNSAELVEMAGQMGLETLITPSEITSNVVLAYARALENSEGSNIETLYRIMDGQAEVLEFNVSSETEFTGVKIRDLKFKPNTLVAGIMRGRKTIIPTGEDTIEVGDRVVVMSSENRLNDLSDIFE